MIVRLLLHASFPVGVLASTLDTILDDSVTIARPRKERRSVQNSPDPIPQLDFLWTAMSSPRSSPVSEADRSIGLSDDKISTNRKWAIYDTSRVHTLLATPV